MNKNEFHNIQKLMEYEKVVVPIIQRDFVYGSKEENSKKFIGDILGGLNESLSVNFGFIYGYHNKDKTVFYVIDGQQRLTILYLLQQYLYWKGSEQKSLFTLAYEVRSTTQDFLTKLSQRLELKNAKNIESSTFFQKEWNDDPSIKAMLAMLDIIHNVSSEYPLVNLESLGKIQFQFLSMDDFGLTDDLYIKMNARGKPLTAFENFKAWLEKEIDSNTVLKKGFELDEEFKNWKTKLDVDWLELFWNTDNNNPVDDLNKWYLRFFYGNAINKVAESEITKDSKETIECFIAESSDSNAILPKNESLKKLFTNDSVKCCFNILDFYERNSKVLKLEGERNFDYYRKCFQLKLFDDTDGGKDIFDDFLKIEKKQKVFISKDHRYRRQIVFYAYISYIMKFGFYNDINLRDWLRVIINLSINADLNVESFMRSIDSIKAIINDPDFSREIYAYLSNKSESVFKGFDDYQAKEEIAKAKLITSDSRWKSALHEAEEHDFFQGQIYFLLQLVGAENGIASQEKLNDFIKYSGKAIEIFKEKNIRGYFLLQRGLLAVCNESYFLESRSWIRRFGSDKSEWRNDFFKKEKFRGKLKKFIDALFLSLSTFKDFVNDEINKWNYCIDSENNWLYFFIKSPEVFKKCGKGNLRYQDGNLRSIYLLDGSRLGLESGGKAELRSYFFYEYYLKSNLSKIDESKKCNYNSTSGLLSLPSRKSCAYIDDWKFRDYRIALDIFYEKDGFCFRFFIRDGIDGKKQKDILSKIFNELKEYDVGGARFDEPCFETDKNDIANLILKFISEDQLISPEKNENAFKSILQTFNDAVIKAQEKLTAE